MFFRTNVSRETFLVDGFRLHDRPFLTWIRHRAHAFPTRIQHPSNTGLKLRALIPATGRFSHGSDTARKRFQHGSDTARMRFSHRADTSLTRNRDGRRFEPFGSRLRRFRPPRVFHVKHSLSDGGPPPLAAGCGLRPSRRRERGRSGSSRGFAQRVGEGDRPLSGVQTAFHVKHVGSRASGLGPRASGLEPARGGVSRETCSGMIFEPQTLGFSADPTRIRHGSDTADRFFLHGADTQRRQIQHGAETLRK